MNNREKKRLSRQLTAQADNLERQDGPELSLSVAAACCALLKAADSTAAISQMDQETFESLYAQFLRMGGELEQFFCEAAGRFQGTVSSSAHADTLEKLRKSCKEADALRAQLVQTRQDLKKVETKMAADRTLLEKAQADLRDAEEAQRTLQKMMETCSKEKIDAQKAVNQALAQQFAQDSRALEELEKEQVNLTEEIRQTEETIAGLPQRNKELLQTWEEKQALLERIRKAQVECSPERQVEMQREIERLSPMVEENQQAVTVLNDRLNDLKEQFVHYDRERQILSTNVLDLWEQSMGDLQTTIADHEGELNKIRATADTLNERLMNCLETRQQYREWLDADSTPLEAMIVAVGRPESEELRKDLDPGRIGQVRQLQTEVEERLRALDAILQTCAGAVRLDQEALNKRARR